MQFVLHFVLVLLLGGGVGGRGGGAGVLVGGFFSNVLLAYARAICKFLSSTKTMLAQV